MYMFIWIKHIVQCHLFKAFILSGFFIWLSSCGGDNGESKREITNKEFYPNGILMYEEIVLNDSNNTRIVKRYYEDGALKDSVPYLGDNIYGIRKFFDRKENLVYFVEYKDGQKNGQDLAYYSSGSLSYKGQRFEDKQVGEWMFYHPNGKLLTYECFAFTGDRMYIRKYDTTGTLISSNGVGLIDMKVKWDSVEVNQPFDARIFLANPPDCKGHLEMVKEIDGLPVDIYKINNNEYAINPSFSAPGIYRINSTWLIEDMKTGKSEKGEQWFEVKVFK